MGGDAAHHKRMVAARDRLSREIAGCADPTLRRRRQDELDKLNRRIAQKFGRADAVVVSEHAILRYLERVLGYDPDELADMVLPARYRQTIAAAGVVNGEVPISPREGGPVTHRVVIRDGVVATISPPGESYGSRR